MSRSDKYHRKGHRVYYLTYHMVFVTKYRKPVITDEIGDFLKNHAAYICERFEGDVISAETGRDYMHLLVELPPTLLLTTVVNTIKGDSSRAVRQKYGEEISKQLHGDAGFWSPSYFVTTTGSVSMEMVKSYIESQRTDDHKRKYTKKGKRNSSTT